MQIASPFGALFLDRTRVRPEQAAIGEALLSLSLAPGEVVVIEQKTFSQRNTTYENVTETTVEQNLELDSSLTTAMELALNQQQTQSTKTDLGAQANINGASAGIPVSVSAQASQSTSDADTTSRNSSLKSTSTASKKVSSKYRSVHKTTLTIATQQQFTSGSQRTIRNPNRFTPIDLRYYKIYQAFQLSHERYGIRLAWNPPVWGPGAAVLDAANRAYNAVIAKAEASVSLPEPPVDPGQFSGAIVVWAPTVTVGGNVFGGSQSVTVVVSPPPVSGTHSWVWDGDADSVINSLNVVLHHLTPPITQMVDGKPWLDTQGRVNATVYVGWDSKDLSAGVDIQISARFVGAEQMMTGQPDPQQVYAEQLAAYNANIASLRAQARSNAEPDAQAAKDSLIAGTDVLTECLKKLLASVIPPNLRVDLGWLEVWRSLFDWNSASFTLYPGWWDDPLPDPTRPADDFVNSIAARLYLPVRPGQEAAAAELVLDVLTQSGQSPAPIDINALVADIAAYRKTNFGSADEVSVIPSTDGSGCPILDEKYICLGRWTELLPTEGTHLEVLQAGTMATDDLNEVSMIDAASRRLAETNLIDSESALEQGVSQHLAGAKVSVSIGVRTSEHFEESRPDSAATADQGPPPA